MQRELWEENGGNELGYRLDEIGTTKVLGFYRWLRRGGKPEFVGITKLNCSLDELNPDQTELIDTTNKAITDTFYLETLDELARVIKDIKAIENTSLPLEMCLDALEYYYQERRSELENLLDL